MRAGLVVAALVMAISSGCATAGSASSGTSKGTRSQDVIAEAEIASRAREATTALQVIEQLRPQMLRGRGVSSPSDVSGEATLPKVYVDEVSYGNLNTLSNVSAGQIKEIRFLNSRDATTRWGTGHMGGVILVTTMKN
jgi:hypothetical protein